MNWCRVSNTEKEKQAMILINPTNAQNAGVTVAAGRTTGLEIQIFNASTGGEINEAFTAIARARADALFVGVDSCRVHAGLIAVSPLGRRTAALGIRPIYGPHGSRALFLLLWLAKD